MPRATAPTFVTTVELLVDSQQAKILRKRFDAARMVYNACLSHYLKRTQRLRDSKDYRRYKGMKSAGKNKEAKALFRSLIEKFQLREFDTNYVASTKGLNWLGDHIGTKEAMATRQRAYKAFQMWMLSGFRDRRPKMRRRDDIRAVESRTTGGIKWQVNNRCVTWKRGGKELVLPAVVDEADEVLMHGLNSPVKYTRLIRKVIRGKERFFAQLNNTGQAFRKPLHQPCRGTVGIDIGTQTIAAVSENGALLAPFCEELKRADAVVRRTQRALDRSRRQTNPNCFDKKGRWIRGQRFVPSKRYLKLKKRLTEVKRKEADFRKNLHGQMVAKILQLGNDVRMEKLEFQSFAKRAKFDKDKPTKKRKRYGKSIGFRAPGMFVARLEQEAAKWAATVEQFNPRTHALSQTCICGRKAKKSLSQRVHKCECGAEAQRDLFSAYLCRYVEKNTLHADQAQKDWSEHCKALRSAWDKVNADTTVPSSLGLRHRPKSLENRRKGSAEVGATLVVSESRQKRRKNSGTSVILDDQKQFSSGDLEATRDSKRSSGDSLEDSS